MRLLVLALALPQLVMSQSSPGTPSSAQPLETSKVLGHIPCAAHPEQSYALYLPSNYSSDRRWPIVYSFDPVARGMVAVELQRRGAERYGYILAASNNSQNGSWKIEREAAEAMFRDTHERLPLDDHAVYFAGFSGGARVAAQIALLCKCATGVLLSGAGFPANSTPARDATFQVFSSVGTLDFNYQEVVPLQEKLEQAGDPHWLYIFDGAHEWAPEEAMEQAFAWFRVQAMKAKRLAQDQTFLAAQFSQAVTHASSTERSGDELGALREYLQIIDTFDGLEDVTVVRAKADSLGKEKSVREAAKQEHKDFEEQMRLTSEVLVGLSAPADASESSPDPGKSAAERARALRLRAEQEKRADRARVCRRALAGVFVGAVETGANYLESHDYAHATDAFSCATEAMPDSEWAWRNLAIADGQAGNRKQTISALKHARDVAKDKAAWTEWMSAEPAFERFRTTSEFQNLLNLN